MIHDTMILFRPQGGMGFVHASRSLVVSQHVQQQYGKRYLSMFFCHGGLYTEAASYF